MLRVSCEHPSAPHPELAFTFLLASVLFLLCLEPSWVFLASGGLSLAASHRLPLLQWAGLIAHRWDLSSQTRRGTLAPCIARRILSHWTTRQVRWPQFSILSLAVIVCSWFVYSFIIYFGFPGGSEGNEFAYYAGDPGSIPGSWKIPWRRKWQPTLVFLPGESHGQRSLVGHGLFYGVSKSWT